MSTLAENAAAVKAAQVAIDAAIVAKGGTTTGGLTNAAAAISSIPAGGNPDAERIMSALATFVVGDSTAKIDLTGLFESPVIINASSGGNGQIFRYPKCEELVMPWCIMAAAYGLANSTILKRATLHSVGNVNYIFNGDRNFTDLTLTGITASVALSGSTSFWNGLEKNITVHCTDADIRYIDGAWVVVERS